MRIIDAGDPEIWEAKSTGHVGLFFFGLPFLLAGLFVLSMPLGLIPVQGDSPPWFFAVPFGSIFALIGLGLMTGRRGVIIEGASSPEFHLRAQCPSCMFRMRLGPVHIGKGLRCFNCERPVYVARHRLVARAAPTHKPLQPPDEAHALRARLSHEQERVARLKVQLADLQATADHRKDELAETRAEISRLSTTLPITQL